MNIRNFLPTVCAVAASCAVTAPDVKSPELNNESELLSASSPAIAEVRRAVAQRRALAELLPEEISPEPGKQRDGSFVSCSEIDVKTLSGGIKIAKEQIAADTCAKVAQAHCSGSANITERKEDPMSARAGKVVTECVQTDNAGRTRVGNVSCHTEVGIYDEVDGCAVVECTRTDLLLY